ncbi:hypothetical protein IGS73_15175 [Janibacter indicus]|uniref:Uncharacterized protein n=1 Tax=Janibacter indicus TaxID=857417 RepID=A0A7L9IZ67_9MICO|nr:hypothetical protein [Janibacter indicus]QOK22404.1 hypothetical protein IGS73_15175 [Janibacter indicus]
MTDKKRSQQAPTTMTITTIESGRSFVRTVKNGRMVSRAQQERGGKRLMPRRIGQ